MLLAHCAAVDETSPTRTPVVVRLEEQLGADLTRLLLVALASHHRDRSRDLAA